MEKPIPAVPWRREFYPVFLLFLLGLFQGLLYIRIIPPWQHYDEPTQFEYAWLLANRDELPTQGEYDQGMRREVAASMIEHQFFRYLQFRPNLLSQDEPIWIGISQTSDRPLYYWFASLPLRLFQGTDITFQLYLGRFVSLLLYLVSILAAYGTATALAPQGHSLRWLLPLTLVMLPGFTELMSAMNNDVGATAFFSLFLWATIVLLKRGFSWLWMAICVGSALACIWIKSTVIAAIPLLIFPVLFSIFQGSRRRLAWILLAAAGIAGILGLITFSEAAFWYRTQSQQRPTRALQPQAPLGKYALELVQSPGQPTTQLFHLLPTREARGLGGKTVTLGAWMWASEPVEARTPALYDGSHTYAQRIKVGAEPTYFSQIVTLNEETGKVSISLSPGVTAVDKPVSVYYDGLVLVEGNHQPDQAPEFLDPDGKQLIWEGKPVTNLVRNGSFETGWFGLRPWVEQFLKTNYPVYSPAILTSLHDFPGAGWYYKVTSEQLLQTFWGRFGWGHILLDWQHSYTFLALFTLAGLIGSLIYLFRRWREIEKEILCFFLASLLAVWGVTFYRGIGSLSGATFIPSARYAYPAIIPTMLVLSIGWLELLRPLSRWKPVGKSLQAALIVLVFLGLALLSVWSIMKFYA